MRIQHNENENNKSEHVEKLKVLKNQLKIIIITIITTERTIMRWAGWQTEREKKLWWEQETGQVYTYLKNTSTTWKTT